MVSNIEGVLGRRLIHILSGLGKMEIMFTLHFSANECRLALPLTSIAVPSKRPGGPIDPEPQAERAKEAVERAKEITKEQKVVLDVLGNARVLVDGIEAILRVVGEVSQSQFLCYLFTQYC